MSSAVIVSSGFFGHAVFADDGRARQLVENLLVGRERCDDGRVEAQPAGEFGGDPVIILGFEERLGDLTRPDQMLAVALDETGALPLRGHGQDDVGIVGSWY